jgi:signal transduction histidine kinase
VAGLAGAAAAWLAAHRSFEPYQTADAPLALLVGWSFIGCGLIAWRQRPRNRLGPVMALTGFAWFATFLTDAHRPLLFTAGNAVESVYLVGVAFVILSFPSGRLRGAFDRAVIVAALALVTVVEIVSLLFSDSGAVICTGCPGNVAEVTRSDSIATGILQGQRVAGVVLTLVTLALLGRHWRHASAPQRRSVAPVLWMGVAMFVALGVSIANDVVGEPLGQAAKWVAYCLFASIPVAVLVALLQQRLARGAVAGLVVELGRGSAAIDLREALSRALGDPSLEIAYWLPAGGHYVDGAGRPMDLPPPGAGRVATVVAREGEAVAALVHDPALRENVELVESACAAAGLALENERLQAELRARLGELQASRARLVEATVAERRRIERDLHDGAQQRLVSIAMDLGLADSRLPDHPGAAARIVRDARRALGVALDELRELSQGIHPSVLSERGLADALDDLCRRAVVPVTLRVHVAGGLPAAVETAAYFVVSEALANTAKHAGATRLEVSARSDGRTLALEIADDGVGGADGAGGSGLRGLADRVEALGGRLTLSSPPGGGTTVRAEMPCG